MTSTHSSSGARRPESRHFPEPVRDIAGPSWRPVTYRLKYSDRTVESGLRRIGLELIDTATDAIDTRDRDASRAVHRVRTSCKRLRGMLRLVRPAFPAYDFENTAFRDIGRKLSPFREADVLFTTFDELSEHDKDADEVELAGARRALAAHKPAATGAAERELAFGAARAALSDARDRVAEWTLERVGYRAIEGGLRRGCRRATKALSAARETGTAHELHEWRKRVKYHGYHTLLLQDIRPARMKPRAHALDRLGERLGESNDLAVLGERLGAIDSTAAVRLDAMMRRIEKRQTAHADAAFELGEILFDEPAAQRVRRWGTWWEDWRRGRSAGER